MVSAEINNIKAGDLVLTKDELDETWLLDLFLYYDDTTIYPYVCSKISWRYCIPYKHNEKYFNSSDNPKNLLEFYRGDRVYAWNGNILNYTKGIYIDKKEDKYLIIPDDMNHTVRFEHCKKVKDSKE